jgi:YD repeat-containing protein
VVTRSGRIGATPKGDVTEAVDPDGQVTHYYYDTRGQLLSIRYPDSSRHKLSWNDLGQLIEETLPDGGVRRFSYDALGRRTTTCDEHGASLASSGMPLADWFR